MKAIQAAKPGLDWLQEQTLWNRAIICGAAIGVQKECADALTHLPGCVLVAVNQSASVIKANVLMTQHPERAAAFRLQSLNPNVEVHTGKPLARISGCDVDVFWPDALRCASSTGSALWLAITCGAREIVICGAPMDGTGGYEAGIDVHQEEPRIGLELGETDYVKAYQSALAEYASKLDTSIRISGTSGFTRRLFGPPDWLKHG